MVQHTLMVHEILLLSPPASSSLSPADEFLQLNVVVPHSVRHSRRSQAHPRHPPLPLPLPLSLSCWSHDRMSSDSPRTCTTAHNSGARRRAFCRHCWRTSRRLWLLQLLLLPPLHRLLLLSLRQFRCLLARGISSWLHGRGQIVWCSAGWHRGGQREPHVLEGAEGRPVSHKGLQVRAEASPEEQGSAQAGTRAHVQRGTRAVRHRGTKAHGGTRISQVVLGSR